MLPLLMNTGTVHDQKEANSERNGLTLWATKSRTRSQNSSFSVYFKLYLR